MKAETLFGVQSPGRANQHLGEVGVDAPILRLVGVGQGVARNFAPPKPTSPAGP